LSNPIRKVLIAGGTGFVGEAVRGAVRDAGYTVRLLVRSTEDARHYEEQGFETEFGDIQDSQSLYVALNDVEAVINLVAIIKENGSATFERVNFQGTANLVSAARQASVERFIQMSALGAGNIPDFPYHYTKWRAETYVQDHIPRWTIIRPSIIFGPSKEGNVQFVGQLADLIRGGPVIPVPGGGRARFQPIHVDDVAAAFVAALGDGNTEGRILEIAGPEVLTYRQMLDAIADTLKVKKPMFNVPVELIRLGVRILNPLPLVEAPVTLDQLDMLQIDNTTSENAISALLGRPPKPFRGNLEFLRQSAD
jgi:uncharacterized protein YbjT (DUF2867 family)